MSTIEKVQEEVLVEELVGLNNEIVLFNDDVNTFDHVIETLIRVCDHDALQAEQCAVAAGGWNRSRMCGSSGCRCGGHDSNMRPGGAPLPPEGGAGERHQPI